MSNSYIPKSFRFDLLVYNPANDEYYNLQYLLAFLKLYIKHAKYLEDDFSIFKQNSLNGALNFLANVSPHCYIVLAGKKFCGFFALENIKGSENKLHSAEVIACFDRKYWGEFTKITALMFKNYCFESLKLRKLKAVVYPQNNAVKILLKKSGFKLEAKLKNETVKNGKYQDLEIYSTIYKNGGKNAN